MRAILFARDLERMTTFYRDALGLPILSGSPGEGWVELAAGDGRLGLHAIPPAIAAGITIRTPPEAREDTPIKLVFEVGDLAAARDRLTAHGAVVMPRPWGSCDALDPEGNVFQITVREK